MKVDLNISVVSRFFRGLLNEFGQKKLWPVAVVLLAAIVAVPVLLTSSARTPPVAQTPLPTPPPSGASLPALNVQSSPGTSRLNGPSHNPFAQASVGTSKSTTSSTASAVGTVGATATSAVTGGSSTGSTSTGSTSTGTGSSSTASSGGTPAVTPPSITGSSKPKPAPTGLGSTQSYDVAMAITGSAGGVNTVDPLERLSLLPSTKQPLLVELGVLQGTNRVVFAVEPGTVVNGPGSCTPGPIDCEILSLGQDQTESISSRDSGANALFAITGITAVSHSSAAAAAEARRAGFAAGKAVLAGSSLPALSLFKYEPSVGAVVDLRDLTVGG